MPETVTPFPTALNVTLSLVEMCVVPLSSELHGGGIAVDIGIAGGTTGREIGVNVNSMIALEDLTVNDFEKGLR